MTCICCENSISCAYLKGLRRCTLCGHVWADTMLSDEEMQALYASKYFQGQVYLDYEKEQPALRRNFIGRLVELQKMYPRGSHLWEIGTAYGFFLDEAAKLSLIHI